MKLPPALDLLIEQMAKLPGIGRKSARRLAFSLLASPAQESFALARAIETAVKAIGFCSQCGAMIENDQCRICEDSNRDQSSILVVEEAKNIFTIEECGAYQGLYHVLGGVIAPMRGIFPEMLAIDRLEHRVESGLVKELILATNPTLEGEATAHYLTDLFQDRVPKITRIARGMPTGGDLEFTDPSTLMRSLEGRTRL